MAPRWECTLRPDGKDTQTYDDVHIDCGLGYERTPIWDDTLDFCFPVGRIRAARVVTFKGDDDHSDSRLLLWSPNTLNRFPFFPGRRLPGKLRIPPHPFCDGHLGPFDSTRSPQYFDAGYPFLPFIRRCETGSFPMEEEECIPAWATWESSTDTRTDKGYVFKAYWRALEDRMHQLHSESAKLLKHPSCRSWNGFVESYPMYPSESDFEQEPGLCRFQDFVRTITSLQRDLRWLVAWVRMGHALTDHRFNYQLRIEEISVEAPKEDLMGLWVNGIPEAMVSWFARCGIPIFVVHEIQGDKDRPENYDTLPKFDHPVKGSDLVEAPVIQRWLKLSDGRLVAGYWDTGVDTNMTMTTDQLSRWCSSPVASQYNFPGDSWYADSPDSPPAGDPIPNTSFVELPDSTNRWKDTSMGSAHGTKYLIPPPVQRPSLGKWEHFAESQTDDGISAFFLVGKKNQTLCSGMTYLFYDRSLRRILHCDGPLPIPKVIAHDTSVYGFPCPRVYFFQDNSLSKTLCASSWLYTTKEALPGDVRRCAPTPTLERISHLIVKDHQVHTSMVTDHSWSEDPTPEITTTLPFDDDDEDQAGVTGDTDSSDQTANMPLTPYSVTSHEEQEPSPEEYDTDPIVDCTLDVMVHDHPSPQVGIETPHTTTTKGDQELDMTNAAMVSDSIPPSPSTTSSISLGESTESSNRSVASGKRRLMDRIDDQRTKHRRTTITGNHRVKNPTFRVMPSRIPNARYLYSQTTPYLCIKGIGRHTIEDLCAWLALSVHTLRITMVIKIKNRFGGGLFVLKFFTKEEAISFKCCYNLWTSKEGDTWAIEYVSHRAILCIPQDRIIAQW